jgi:hypothetical protein
MISPASVVWVLDVIVLVVFIQAIALCLFARARQRAHLTLGLLATLVAGAALLVALRLALAGIALHWVGLCLLVSLLAHLVDLRLRWGLINPPER